jgi:uncharacterized protein YcgI (DUF1989 family)
LNFAFYSTLVERRESFERVSVYPVDPATHPGHAFRVEAGQAFRLVVLEHGQIIDTMFYNADDPTERYASGAQFAIEGGQITRLTRIWGNPPHSRPLATVTADTLRVSSGGKAGPMAEHLAFGGHCNPHHYALLSGTHPHTCYDNFRAALATVGLSQRWAGDNMNLFSASGLDPTTGDYFIGPSHAERGDYIEFYAEIALLVAISLCPAGSGGVSDGSDGWRTDLPIHPIGLEIYNTGVEPLPWPNPESSPTSATA